MATHAVYSADQVVITLDGRRVIGLDEGDNAFEVAPLSNRGEIKVGVHGDSIFSGSTNRGARVTLRLQHTSQTHRYLVEKDQQARAGIRRQFPLSMREIGSGEGGSSPKMNIEQAPTMTKGMNATVREWVLVTGEWSEDIPNEAT